MPGDVVATVMVSQSLEGLSDRDAVDAFRTDLKWKVACGVSLADEGFHPTELTLWRNRLRASDAPERIFDAVRAVVAETGVLREWRDGFDHSGPALGAVLVVRRARRDCPASCPRLRGA